MIDTALSVPQEKLHRLPTAYLHARTGCRRRDRSRAGTWSGGRGTDFFVDQDGTVGIMFTQVELGERMSPLLAEFKALHQPT